MKSPLALIAIVVVLAVGAYFWMKQSAPAADAPASGTEQTAGSAMPVPTSGTPATDMTVTKEFIMTAYYDEKGKWFSLKDISVKKGDHVSIKITNTKGMHDFVIDEYGIDKDLPLNQEVVVDFVADKAGSFTYYCSKPGHRAAGQSGTLTVTE